MYNEYDEYDDYNEKIYPRREAQLFGKQATSTETLPEKEQVVSLPSYSNSYSRTQLESTKFDYTWEINHFTYFVRITNTLISAPFPETSQYNIRMNVDHKNQEKIIRFYVCTNKEFLGLCQVFSIPSTGSSSLGSIIECFKSSGTLVYEIKENSLVKYLCEDTLKLTFKFEIFHKLRTNIIYGNVTPSSAIFSEEQTSENSILHDSKSDDINAIKIIINKESYTVPKDLLNATNSAYFKALCNTKKEISMTDELIANNELEVFKDMLSFITTGTNPSFNGIGYCMRLLKVAHKYDVCDLKLICERHLVDCIRLKNAVEMIQLAFSCDAKFLEKYALSFIKIHMKKIANSKEFQSLPQEYLEKLMKLIEISKTSELCVVESVMSTPSFNFKRD